jgi:hypothetical protein
MGQVDESFWLDAVPNPGLHCGLVGGKLLRDDVEWYCKVILHSELRHSL